MRTNARVPTEKRRVSARFITQFVGRSYRSFQRRADTAWEMIAVIIFQGLGAGKKRESVARVRNGDNETDAGRPVDGAVKYQREFFVESELHTRKDSCEK